MANAPTFEQIFTLTAPRTDIPHFTPHRRYTLSENPPPNDLQRQIASRMLAHTARTLNANRQHLLVLHETYLKPSKTIDELSKNLTDALQKLAATKK